MDVTWYCPDRENKPMTTVSRTLFSLFVLLLPAGCSVLPQPAPEAINTYVLDYPAAPAVNAAAGNDLPVLIVSTPRAHGGYDTTGIAYMQQTYGLRYFARSRWADTPARMLAPLIADAVQASGQFQALYATPGSVAADLRLDTELIRLHQDFRRQPGEVRITLQAWLIDLKNNGVIATRQLDSVVATQSDDAYGGVIAANRAVGQLLDELARFCAGNRP
jgi:cholesterol transport system auxiliary component